MQRTAPRSRTASSPPAISDAAGKRRLRSQSVELGIASDMRGAQGRRQRQGTAESAASNLSASHKTEGKGSKIVHDLSRVQEDPESDLGSEGVESSRNDRDTEESASSSDESSQNKPGVKIQDGPAAPKFHQETSQQNFNNKDNIEALKKWRSKVPASNPAPVAPASRQAQFGPSVVQPKVRRRGDSNSNRSPQGSSVEDIQKMWEAEIYEKNKENKRPSQTSGKRRLIDHHPAAYKVSFESQEDGSATSNRKRPATATEEDEEDDGQDDFQTDTRAVDESRKSRAPPSQRISAQHDSKRTRIENIPRSSTADRLRYGQEQGEASVRNSQSPESPPLSTQAKVLAKINTQRATSSDHRIQTRTPWSTHDEELLVELIAQFGPKWSVIAPQPGWDIVRPNFQGQLKDKARNMKVAYLKSHMGLPHNFHLVRLGKKEVDIVRRVIPDYDQDNEA